ncbi:HAD family hydrolase [Paenibacillus sedimenti]|uniref:HAD-IA family hydrolase n=1 Tax=Paenibacillus sedimenti TaxID=2770274 RepID=A0A926KQE8_9BACL|nr:HAD-IA family hydrolase [Paenibacillus sedimenti]MBD0380180.1 HAD-IA family hydrolase [Paenibacillus sedimenti]
MMKKPQLILDMAGVIITNLSPSFWEEIATTADISYNDLKTLFKNEVRDHLWTGVISEEEFWTWLHNHFPILEVRYTRPLINKHLVPLPAIEQISKWSDKADIHLLSNHRNEWLAPLLNPISKYLKSITISSEVGNCKPDPKIYQLVQEKIVHRTTSIIYVDDQQKNLIPAEELGWETVFADQEGKWVTEITNRLNLIKEEH